MRRSEQFIHPTADVSPQATIGDGVKIWHHAQIRENAIIGANCIIGKGVYIDHGVSVGANSKIQNGALVCHGARLEEGVFLGPDVMLTNDRLPRAITLTGELKSADDWQLEPTLIRRGASIGARVVILPGLIIDAYAMIGAGAVVTRDVPAHGLVYGNPARLHGYVCQCGNPMVSSGSGAYVCQICNVSLDLD